MSYKESEGGANRGAGSPNDRRAGGKNTGTHDFGGQEGYDTPAKETQETEAREGMAGVPIHLKRQHNEHNGAGRSRRVIASNSHELHGGLRTTDAEGGEP